MTEHMRDDESVTAFTMRRFRNEVLEQAAKAAEDAYGDLAHTYASENADLYRGQDLACKRIAARIRRMKQS